MAAAGIAPEDMGNALLWGYAICAFLGATAVVLGLSLLRGALPMLLPAVALCPLVWRQYVMGLPAAMAREEERLMAAEAPEVVGTISIALSINPSLEDAVRCHGDQNVLWGRIRRLQWEVTLGRCQDLPSALHRLSQSLGEDCQALRQALYLLIGATRERSPSGRRRLLDRANSLVIEGMRERVGRYSASLHLPTMAIFSFGIILPILVFTIVPMASMDIRGGQPSSSIDALCTATLLVVVPLMTLLIARGMVRRNPLCSPVAGWGGCFGPRGSALVLCSLALGAGICLIPGLRPLFAIIVSLPASLTVAYLLRARIAGEHLEKESEAEVGLALFEMGNLLQSGFGPEQAMQIALSSRPESRSVLRMRRCLSIHLSGLATLRGAMEADDVLRRSAPMSTKAVVAVLDACERDPATAGALALDLAQYLWELRRAKEAVRQQLKSMLDMMTFTACVFAPMVIGLTTSIFGAISAAGNASGGMRDADIIGGVYVLELCLVSAYLTTFIGGSSSWMGWCWRSAITCPVAAVVLISASALSGSLVAL
jgi:hypothetical protein